MLRVPVSSVKEMPFSTEYGRDSFDAVCMLNTVPHSSVAIKRELIS